VLSPPQHGADEILLLETMSAHRFDFMGSMRSYDDLWTSIARIDLPQSHI
jgi:hypothetical protein